MTASSDYIENWVGQKIRVGDIVGRGARDGNTTVVRVGRVIYVNPEKGTVKIQYLLEPTYGWERQQGRKPWRWLEQGGIGSPSIDTVFLLNPATFGFDMNKEVS